MVQCLWSRAKFLSEDMFVYQLCLYLALHHVSFSSHYKDPQSWQLSLKCIFSPRRLSVLPPHKCHSHPCQLELFQYDLLCRHNIRFYWQNPDVSGLRHICVPSHTIWETLLWMHEKVMRISYLPLLNTHEDVMIYKCMLISSTEGTIIS